MIFRVVLALFFVSVLNPGKLFAVTHILHQKDLDLEEVSLTEYHYFKITNTFGKVAFQASPDDKFRVHVRTEGLSSKKPLLNILRTEAKDGTGPRYDLQVDYPFEDNSGCFCWSCDSTPKVHLVVQVPFRFLSGLRIMGRDGKIGVQGVAETRIPGEITVENNRGKITIQNVSLGLGISVYTQAPLARIENAQTTRNIHIKSEGGDIYLSSLRSETYISAITTEAGKIQVRDVVPAKALHVTYASGSVLTQEGEDLVPLKPSNRIVIHKESSY